LQSVSFKDAPESLTNQEVIIGNDDAAGIAGASFLLIRVSMILFLSCLKHLWNCPSIPLDFVSLLTPFIAKFIKEFTIQNPAKYVPGGFGVDIN